MIKAIIFDIYGVLFPDTYWTLAGNYLGDDFSGKKPELRELIRKVDLGYITRDDLWAEFAVIVGQNRDTIDNELKEMGGLDKRLLAFIESKKSDYKIGVISNVGQGFIERMFTDKPPEHYFDSLVLSSEVGLVKPDRKIYEKSAKQLNCNTEECVFIDDLEKNAKGAEIAGMKGIQYISYNQLMKDLANLGIE